MTLLVPWMVAWIAGIFVLVEGLGNALVPMSRNADATKIWRSIARLVRAALSRRGPGEVS